MKWIHIIFIIVVGWGYISRMHEHENKHKQIHTSSDGEHWTGTGEQDIERLLN